MSIEAHYNAAGQQRLGWMRRLLPAEGDDEALRVALRDGSYQTHPELSGYVLSVVAAGFRAGRDEGLRLLERARTTYAPLCGGAGDRLFHGALEPAGRLLGVLAALLLLGRPGQWRIQALPPVLAVVPALLVWALVAGAAWIWRRRAERVGNAGETALREEFLIRPWERWIGIATRIRAFATGAVLGLTFISLVAQGRIGSLSGFLALVGVGAWVMQKRIGPATLGVLCILLGVLVGWAGRWIDTGGLP